jgi:hypothetical protein
MQPGKIIHISMVQCCSVHSCLVVNRVDPVVQVQMHGEPSCSLDPYAVPPATLRYTPHTTPCMPAAVVLLPLGLRCCSSAATATVLPSFCLTGQHGSKINRHKPLP